MLLDLAIGVPTMVTCLLLQALVFLYALRYYNRLAGSRTSVTTWSSLGLISGVMLLLVLGNLAQIAVWACLFRLLGEFGSLPAAIYHSAVNFATLGYGDVVMSEAHRLLGPLEAINGALMIGVSTAALTAAFQQELRGSARDPQR